MKKSLIVLIGILIILTGSAEASEDFYIDSPRNKGTLRLEINNDAFWMKDSNFSNGWSIQYHTIRYPTWDESRSPGFIKWVGNHFPSLNDDESIVRYGQGIGQNIFTPGDLSNPNPPPGDLPYAGTLTYSLNWQSFNRQTARVFQISVGVLGRESLSEDVQKFIHNDLGFGPEPKGWDTQRDTEPVINLAYQYIWRLAKLGVYNNGWAGQFSLGPGAYLGNLMTAVDLAFGFRFGWNMQEGFGALPAPPGGNIFESAHIPKPASTSSHGVELVSGIRGSGVIYSVIYDGSFITDDDRKVDRENFVYSVMIGVNYHYYDYLSLHLSFIKDSDLLVEESIPTPSPGKVKTGADTSYGTIMIDYHF